MAGEDEKSRYYIDPDSGMLIAGGEGGPNSQGEVEWTPEQLQAWEGGDASSYESSAGGHDTNASTTSSYAALGNAFGKSTWNASTTVEEEDWTGIGASTVAPLRLDPSSLYHTLALSGAQCSSAE